MIVRRSFGMGQRALGNLGEDVATAYLRQRGYAILERNWSVRGRSGRMIGEIDIIARRGKDIVFVEVKAGSSISLGAPFRPELHVTGRKAQRIVRAAELWLSAQGFPDAPWQVDVIAVDIPERGPARVRHLPAAVTRDTIWSASCSRTKRWETRMRS